MKGDEQVYPRSITGSHMGITYRQYLAAEIAGHMAANDAFTNYVASHVTGENKPLDIFGKTVWLLADIVLEAEHET